MEGMSSGSDISDRRKEFEFDVGGNNLAKPIKECGVVLHYHYRRHNALSRATAAVCLNWIIGKDQRVEHTANMGWLPIGPVG